MKKKLVAEAGKEDEFWCSAAPKFDDEQVVYEPKGL